MAHLCFIDAYFGYQLYRKNFVQVFDIYYR